MGAVLEDELLGGTAFIHEEEGDAAVRVSEGQISDAGMYVSACLDSHCSRFHHLGGVGKIVVVALEGADCASSGIIVTTPKQVEQPPGLYGPRFSSSIRFQRVTPLL